VAQPIEAPVTPVRGRLDRALVDYLDTLTIDDLGEVSIETVAQAAGVSRATAYRHFGDRDGLLFRAAMELTRQHAEIVMESMAEAATVAAKVEEAFAYTARQVKVDKVLRLLLLTRRPETIDDAMRNLSLEIMGPAYRKGQLDGQVREDLSVEELISWLSEQRNVMTRLQLDEPAARVWVRRFVLPALRPQASGQAIVPEVKAVLADLNDRVVALKEVVERTRLSLP
jgi:AcrR family transcriptional regulator